MCRVGEVNRAPLDSVLPEHYGEVAEGAAIGVVDQDHVIAGPEQRTDQRRRRHPRSGRHRPPTRIRAHSFERGQRRLQGGPGGVGGPGVLVPLVFPGPVLRIGRGGVDGHHHRPRGRVRLLSGVDGARLELHQSSTPCSSSQRSLKILER